MENKEKPSLPVFEEYLKSNPKDKILSPDHPVVKEWDEKMIELDKMIQKLTGK